MKEIPPGVSIVLHGVHISGDNGGDATHRQQQQPRSPRSHEQPEQMSTSQNASEGEPMETVDSPAGETKKQQKDARKLEKFLDRKRAERWLPLVLPYLRTVRGFLRDSVWTEWMRARPQSLVNSDAWFQRRHSQERRRRNQTDTLRKLRDLLWKAWTHRHLGGSTIDPVLGLTSERDEYIRLRVYDLCEGLLPEVYGKLKSSDFVHGGLVHDPVFGPQSFDDADDSDMQAAIAASIAEISSPARNPSDRQVGKSKSHEAGVRTPLSARARKKEVRRATRPVAAHSPR